MIRKYLPGFLILLCAALLIYAPGIGTPYFMDDLGRIYYPPPANPFQFFFQAANERDLFYRPIEYSALSILQRIAGFNTVPLHLIQISLHVWAATLIFVVARRLGFSKLQAGGACVYFLVAQSNTITVISNDTLSQLGGTIFGILSLWLLYDSRRKDSLGESTSPNINYWLSVVTFALSLFFKESSVLFIVIAVMVLWLREMSPTQGRSLSKQVSWFLKNRAIQLLPFVAAFVFYMGLRATVVGLPWVSKVSESVPFSYQPSLGLNVIKNIGMFIFASILPISTADLVIALKAQHWGAIAVALVLSFLFFGCVVYGLWKSPQKPLLAVLAVFAVINFFPMAIMMKVSEHQLYNAIPLIALLVGAGLGTFLESLRSRSPQKAALVGFISLIFISHGVAVHAKSAMMQANGQRAQALLMQLTPYIQKAPPNSKVLLLNPVSDRPEYSVLLLNDFNVVRDIPSDVIKRLGGQNNVSAYAVDADTLNAPENQGSRIVLSLAQNKITVLSQQ